VKVLFHVYVNGSAKDVTGANVLLGQIPQTTDESGKAMFTLPAQNNNLAWQVAKAGYVTKSGRMEIAIEDKSVDVDLMPIVTTTTSSGAITKAASVQVSAVEVVRNRGVVYATAAPGCPIPAAGNVTFSDGAGYMQMTAHNPTGCVINFGFAVFFVPKINGVFVDPPQQVLLGKQVNLRVEPGDTKPLTIWLLPDICGNFTLQYDGYILPLDLDLPGTAPNDNGVWRSDAKYTLSPGTTEIYGGGLHPFTGRACELPPSITPPPVTPPVIVPPVLAACVPGKIRVEITIIGNIAIFRPISVDAEHVGAPVYIVSYAVPESLVPQRVVKQLLVYADGGSYSLPLPQYVPITSVKAQLDAGCKEFPDPLTVLGAMAADLINFRIINLTP
jgi:hypothetical protein